MRGIDDRVIERVFSPVSGWLRHRLGIDQWRVALECLNGHLAFYLAGVALTIAASAPQAPIFADMLSAFVWLWIMDRVRIHARRQAASSMGVQSARLGEWLLRAILLLALPVSLCFAGSLASLCYTLSLMFLTAHLYFKAADTPPPERGRRLALGRA